MGEVYRARDTKLDRNVPLKVLGSYVSTRRHTGNDTTGTSSG